MSDSINPIPEHDPSLDWMAFCYVTDELSEADRRSFEQRLEVDQQARESVAMAYGQIQTLKAALQPTSVVKSANSWIKPTERDRNDCSRLPFVLESLAAIAATLLIGLFLWQNFGGKSVPPAANAPGSMQSLESFENLISAELSNNEAFAAVVVQTMETDEPQWNEMSEDRDDIPVTFDGDWMVEAMTELGSELEGLDSDSDFEAS